jgi:hypothetical protein
VLDRPEAKKASLAMALPLRHAVSLRLTVYHRSLLMGLRPISCGHRPLNSKKAVRQVADLPRGGVAEPYLEKPAVSCFLAVRT